MNIPTTSTSSNEAQRIKADDERSYSCKYCNKKFSVKQGLGGHQNAHKEERAAIKEEREAIKRRKILSMTSTLHDSHPNLNSHSQHKHNESCVEAKNSWRRPHIRTVKELDFMHLLGGPQFLGSKSSLQSGVCDNDNPGQASSSSKRLQSESIEELDLTLKL
ncbi:hypothetical protein RIF29_28957 [Crotalaria pallida]|uniref:C2H2-type domain-containing protein n=1 Tax=Crotalaria pallida TaxID=3830 RepID=A0AAN9EEK8_CROPI